MPTEAMELVENELGICEIDDELGMCPRECCSLVYIECTSGRVKELGIL